MPDRETIIETGGDGGATAVVAGVVVALLVVVGFFFIINMNRSSGTLDIDVPAVTVGVTPDGQ